MFTILSFLTIVLLATELDGVNQNEPNELLYADMYKCMIPALVLVLLIVIKVKFFLLRLDKLDRLF